MKRSNVLTLGVLLVAVAAIVLLRQFLFTVQENEQVIVTQFGEHKKTIREPGLAVKKPFVQLVIRFDKRILSSDAPQAEYLTQDKKRLVADPITRWRIEEPLLFYKTVRHESGARARLDDLVLSEVRREVASHTFDMVIGAKREVIMEAVAKSAREKAKEFGIEVIDVRIKRADLPREVQASVFSRMEAEREREAKRYRSEGEEESFKLRAETDKERTILLAEAEQRSQILRGEGDAEATRVYAAAFNRDPEFYSFVRSLEAYETFMGQRSTLFLSTSADLFRYLGTPKSPAETK
jgi:modulator of FtsH protease HflC